MGDSLQLKAYVLENGKKTDETVRLFQEAEEVYSLMETSWQKPMRLVLSKSLVW